MKGLTMNQVARSSMKANKKVYFSLAIGILLAIYLCTATVLGVYGSVKANEQKVINRVGYIDAFFPNCQDISDETIRSSGFFTRVGKVFVTAQIDKTGQYVGYYDEEAQALMPRKVLEGQLPQSPGEIALEENALAQLRIELQVGDSVTWTMRPLEGLPEERTYRLVGILANQATYMESYGTIYSDHGTSEWPNALVYPGEVPFQAGNAAVHRVVTYAPLMTYARFTHSEAYETWGYNFVAISRSTGQSIWMDPTVEDINNYAVQAETWILLGCALLLSCGVAISSAMESMLAQKTEEIGMLRAVGATRRQIRRMFGRDAWLLCLIALPLGITLGILTVWIISRFAEGTILFCPNGWLFLPVMAFSALCIFLSSRLPLRRAAQQMPMGVLRDTGLLRKAKKFRSKQQFRGSRLIAGRQARLHPLRQAGASVMVILTLLSTAILSEALLDQSAYKPEYDFLIQPMNGHYHSFHSSGDLQFAQAELRENILTQQDIQQIRSIPQVASVSLITWADVLLELQGDEVPLYFRDYYTEEETGSYTDTDGSERIFHQYSFHNVVNPYLYTNSLAWLLEDTADRVTDLDTEYLEWNAKAFQEMQAAQRGYGVRGKLVPLTIEVRDIDDPQFQKGLKEGKIDSSALDAGREILVVAPDQGFWETSENGKTVGNIAGADFGQDHPGAVLKGIATNDYFRAGMSLSLIQALAEKGDELLTRSSAPFTPAELAAVEQSYSGLQSDQATVTVGAVLQGGFAGNNLCLVTTEKGLRALGFAPTDPTFIEVSLASEVDQETEEAIQHRLETIAARAGMEVINTMENARKNARMQRQIEMVFLGIIVLFFAVSVSMQVSNVGRRIRADQLMIGTLRAVGADEKALLGCYRLPMTITTAVGLLLALAIYALLRVLPNNYFMTRHAAVTMPLMVVLAVLCAICCMSGIKGRLRQVLSKSVVENIREL